MTDKWRRGYSLLLPHYSSRQEVPSDSSMLLRCIYSQQSMFSGLFPNLSADLTSLLPPIIIQYVHTFWNPLLHIQDERERWTTLVTYWAWCGTTSSWKNRRTFWRNRSCSSEKIRLVPMSISVLAMGVSGRKGAAVSSCWSSICCILGIKLTPLL